MAEVDRRSGIDCVHILIAYTVRLVAYAARQHSFGEAFRPVAKGEQAFERADFQEIASQQPLLPPPPFLCCPDGWIKADIHVGVAKDQVALDEHFFGDLLR